MRHSGARVEMLAKYPIPHPHGVEKLGEIRKTGNEDNWGTREMDGEKFEILGQNIYP